MIETLIQTKRLAASRVRAGTWGLRGARIGAKVNVGPFCRVDRPSGVTLSNRVTLEPGVWLKLVDPQALVEIGEFTFLGQGTQLDVADKVTIGSGVLIAPRVFITDHSHNAERGTGIVDQGCNAAAVDIGDDVWIGTSATILSGVSIGAGAIVGAGAVVRKSIPANEVWAGVPAQKIRER